MTEPRKSVLEVKFAGTELDRHGIPIYELGITFVSIQRLLHKAHLARNQRLRRRGHPPREERGMLALQIGERKRGSDWFSLLPVLADSTTLSAIRQAADYVIAGLVSYAIGDVLNRIGKERNESRREFIGASYPDTVNIVNVVGNVGGCQRVEINSPVNQSSGRVVLDSNTRDYVRSIESDYILGEVQTIEGKVYRLYPDQHMIEIRRSSRRLCKVFLNARKFDDVRYGQKQGGPIKVKGRPRFRLGEGTRSFREFEGHDVFF